MMKMFVILVVLLNFGQHSAFRYIDKYGASITYDVTFKSKCQLGEDIFRRIVGIGLPDCVRECGLRLHCEALNYRRKQKVCDMLTKFDAGNLGNGECIFISSSDIKVDKKLYWNCSYGQVCDMHSNDCIYKECLRVEMDNAIVLGNVNEVGSKVRYNCNHGYKNRNRENSSICQENGQWNATADCRIDCGQPPSVLNGTVSLDIGSGTTYMDTATVTCDAWYQTRRSKITCLETGNWESTKCADCYLTTPEEYAGKRNSTESGTACQRWDAQYPHIHSYTNPSTYPEATLQLANNYCRNPDTDTFEPWCYTMNAGVRWEYCDISKCD